MDGIGSGSFRTEGGGGRVASRSTYLVESRLPAVQLEAGAPRVLSAMMGESAGEGERGGVLNLGASTVLGSALGLGMGFLGEGRDSFEGDVEREEEGEDEADVDAEEEGVMEVASLSSPSDLEEGPILGLLSFSSEEPRSDSDLAFFRGRGVPELSVGKGKQLSPEPILGGPWAAPEGPGLLSGPGRVWVWANRLVPIVRPLWEGPGVLIMGGLPPDMI